MKRMLLLSVILATCPRTPEQQQRHIDTLHDAARMYAASLKLTAIAIVCRGYTGSSHRCDLNTREAGVLPLKCFDGACRLLD